MESLGIAIIFFYLLFHDEIEEILKAFAEYIKYRSRG
jgi:hypothetical protein